jgi:hypothetical protein
MHCLPLNCARQVRRANVHGFGNAQGPQCHRGSRERASLHRSTKFVQPERTCLRTCLQAPKMFAWRKVGSKLKMTVAKNTILPKCQ